MIINDDRLFNIEWDNYSIQTAFENGYLTLTEKQIIESLIIVTNTKNLKTFYNRVDFIKELIFEADLLNVKNMMIEEICKVTVNQIFDFTIIANMDIAKKQNDVTNIRKFTKWFFKRMEENKKNSITEEEINNKLVYIYSLLDSGIISDAVKQYVDLLNIAQYKWEPQTTYFSIMRFVGKIYVYRENEEFRRAIIKLCEKDIRYFEILETERYINCSSPCFNRLVQLYKNENKLDKAIEVCKLGIKYQLKGFNHKVLKSLENRKNLGVRKTAQDFSGE